MTQLLTASNPTVAPMQSVAPEPFVWGAGGRRLTPEELARQQEIAQSLMQSDYSPVQHWTQGLGRVADNVMGALDSRRLDKVSEANAAESEAVIRALMTGDGAAQPGGADPVIAALVNPYISDEARGLAGKMWDRNNPKPSAPPDVIQLQQIADDPSRTPNERKAAADRVMALNDPIVNVEIAGRTFVGPRSVLMSQIGGQAGAAAPRIPPQGAVAELLADPSGAAEFDQVFGAGSAARVLGGGGAGSGPQTFP